MKCDCKQRGEDADGRGLRGEAHVAGDKRSQQQDPGIERKQRHEVPSPSPTPYIDFRRRRIGFAGTSVCGQPAPASPIGRAGDPAQRWPAGTWLLMTAPASTSAPAPTDAPGISTARVPNAGVVADPQLADNQLVPVDPPAVDIDVWLERGAIADGDQAGGRRQRAQPRAVADPDDP